jgi:bis(5'-nucleosidyl)-tetraphosphatase
MVDIIGRHQKVRSITVEFKIPMNVIFISGHLDKGESPLQAAERETKEEAGLDKNDVEYYNKFEEKITYNVNGRLKDVFYYLARIRNNQQNIKLSDEHQNLTWSNLQDACNLVKHDEMQNVLRKAEQFILNYQ